MSFRVVIDGSNLLKPNDSLDWSLDYLLSAMDEVKRAAQSADAGRQLQLKVMVDAASFYRLSDDDQSEFEQLQRGGEVERTPSRSEADPYILDWAVRNDGLVVSNDGYGKFVSQHPWINDPGRIAGALYDTVSDSWAMLERNYGRNTPRSLVDLLLTQAARPATPPTPAPAPPVATVAAVAPPVPPPGPASIVRTVTPYETPITRQHPALMMLLLDQSGSMQNVWWHGGTKAQGLAEVVNNLIESISLNSIRSKEVRHYFDLAVLGYSGDQVMSMFRDTTITDPVVSIVRASALGEKQKIQQGGITVERVVWVGARASGQTPMCKALYAAVRVAKDWAANHQDSFPPVVINISDGMPNDGDVSVPAGELAQVQTKHGSALFFNCHISGPLDQPPTPGGSTGSPTPKPSTPPSSAGGGTASILFPDENTDLPSRYAEDLFEISSVLPDSFRRRAIDLEFEVNTGARGFMYNATAADLVRFLNVGTPAAAKN